MLENVAIFNEVKKILCTSKLHKMYCQILRLWVIYHLFHNIILQKSIAFNNRTKGMLK